MNKTDSHDRRVFLKRSLGALLGAACWKPAAEAMPAEDPARSHTMLVVGQQTVYLSHLPLFSSPHDYQAIFQATFSKAGSNPQTDYFNDRKRSGVKIYTL